MSYQPLLLIIDDETAILKTLKEALEDEGFRVQTLNETTHALDLIGQLVPDLILLDIFMPNQNGLDFLEKIKKEYPDQQIMIISGFGTIQIALDAIKRGACNFIEKPLNLDEILSKIEYLKKNDYEHSINLQTNHHKTNEPYEAYGIVGKSYLFQELMYQIHQIIKLPFPVLIYGQHGVGKNLIAHYIHQKNNYAYDTFFELHESTNATLMLKTFFTSLDQGTLYIKNIEMLSPTIQRTLLSYLEQHHNTQLKIIASSTISLFKLVQEEKFDGTLFYHLNVIPLEIPPLSKRRYDIPLLINHYLNQENEKQKKSIAFSAASMRFLRNHSWHGNVFELKTFIKKIVTLTNPEQHMITPQELHEHLNEKDHQLIEEQAYTHYSSLQEATAAFEKKFLLHLLKKNRYDLEQLSDRLNLNIPQLRAKMLELSIEFKGQ